MIVVVMMMMGMGGGGDDLHRLGRHFGGRVFGEVV